MERWKEIFIGKIPKAVYQMQLTHGEKQGLTIELSNGHTCVMIKFGVVQAVRMLDEGIVQSGLYCDSEIKKYKEYITHIIIPKNLMESMNFGNAEIESDNYVIVHLSSAE